MKYSKTLRVLFIITIAFNLLYITIGATQAYFKTPTTPPNYLLDAIITFCKVIYKVTFEMTIFIFLFVHIFDLREEKETPLFDFEKDNDGIK